MAIREEIKPQAGKIVDMSWDPITRIVGNLGINGGAVTALVEAGDSASPQSFRRWATAS